ncbi:MAG: FtsX-like permease family protein [Proteocatella sp.]
MLLVKKIFRDLRTNKGANIAATVLISISFMIFSLMSNIDETLTFSKEQFYQETKFADVFVEVRGYPKERIKLLEKIEGVETVQGRIVEDFIINEEDKNQIESKYLRIFAGGESLCTYVVESGKYPTQDREIVIDPNFAKENNINIGEEIEIILNGELSKLKVVGIGRSSENIFTTRKSSDIFPDPKMFGVGYTNIDVMGGISGGGIYNNIIFKLKKGYEYDQVKDEISSILKPYGVTSQLEAKDQQSNAYMAQELDSIKAISTSMPMMFLSIASAIVYIMLKRLVELQRGQIGILKAFGFSDFQISFHYILYVCIMSVSGAIIGSLSGTALSRVLMGVYEQFFNMPFILGKANLKYIVISMLMAVIFGIVTGFLGGKEALKLSPAEAMRPKGPVGFSKKLKIEKLKFIMDCLTMTGRIGLRNLGRNKSRGIFIIIGVSFTVAICSVPWTMMGQMLPMIYERYDYVEKYDLKIQLDGFRDIRSILSQIDSENVKKSEALIEVPATFRKANLKKDSIMVGVESDGLLYTPVNSKKEKLPISDGQLFITLNIANKLDVKVGDYVYVSSPMAKDPDEETKIMVSFIEEQLIGSNGYMNIESVSNLLGYKGSANEIVISAEDEKLLKIKDKYIDSPYITSITISDSLLKMFQEMMSLVVIEIGYLGIIAIVTGFAIIYNSTITVISEREREMTSMMVIGMSEREVFDIVSFEQWILSIFGMLLGAPLTKILLVSMAKAVETDLFTMPSNFDIRFYLISILVTVIAIILGQVAAYRKIKRLNLVDALKSNE